MSFVKNISRKLSLFLKYGAIKIESAKSNEKATRYRGCFFSHEPHNTLIARIRRKGSYEPYLEHICNRILPTGGLFIDVGANIGLISLPLLKQKDSAKAILFEPSPVANRLLNKNIMLNELTGRAVAYNCALSNQNSEAVLFAVNEYDDTSMDGLIFTERTKGCKAIEVRQKKLDDIIREISVERIDIIKIDCEGAELLVLQGAAECITQFKPIVFMECTPINYSKYGTHLRDIWNLTRDIGYKICSTSFDVIDLFELEIKVGSGYQSELILMPENHPWVRI